MTLLRSLATLLILTATPMAAETILPEIPQLSEEDSAALLTDLAVASVVSQNCDGFAITDAEYDLLSGASGILSARFQLDPPTYNEMFLHPAYGVLADEDGCAQEGPQIQSLIDRLIGWGAALMDE